VTGAGLARLWFTDRYGVGGAGSNADGPTLSPYGAFNLASHVGDDRAVVESRRQQLTTPAAVFMDQVHGRHVAVVTDRPSGPMIGTDGLVTTRRDVPLAVLVADCLPVLMYEPKAEVIGSVHAGRRGIELGVLAAAVQAIESCGGEGSRVLVTIGPSIGPCCYEVPAQMRDAVCAVVPAAASTTRWGTPSIDLRAAALAQLGAAGVHQVAVSDVCTFESPRHYSYRRDGVTGRFAGVVVLPGLSGGVAER
jgi:YfiH family protein